MQMMDRCTAERCVELMRLGVADGSLATVDITGGAPELNAQFKYARVWGSVSLFDLARVWVLQMGRFQTGISLMQCLSSKQR